MTSMLKNMITSKVEKKPFLVVKFIGSLEDRKGLRCISSKWLNSVLDKIVFVRYPPPNQEQNTLGYISQHLPVFAHWQTYLATVYYQSDDLEDAILYAMSYTPPCNEAQSNPLLTVTTDIQNRIINESDSYISTATRGLTLTEQFKIIRPLVVSILRSIDLCSDECSGQSHAYHYNPDYKYLKEQASTYAKFLPAKIIRYIRSYWTDAVDKTQLLSTSMKARRDVSAASKVISGEVKKAIVELLLMIDAVSE